MYARLFKVVLGPDTRQAAEGIADFFDPLLHELAGFREAIYFADYEVGEYGSLTMWDSEDSANESAALVYSLLTKMVTSIYQWAPQFQVFEVYQPKLTDRGDESHQ